MNAGTDDPAFCAAEVRAHDFERYASTLFVGAEPRRAWLALFAFDLEIARVREHITQPLPGEIRLQWWTDTLTGIRSGESAGNPVAAELERAIGMYRLPVELLTRLIEARRFDLYDDPMRGMAELEVYLDESVGALYRLATQVVGGDIEQAASLAHHAGVAQGIVSLIRLLPLHASRGQVFLPTPLLQAHGITRDEMVTGRSSGALRAAVQELAGEGRRHLEAAKELLVKASSGARAACLDLNLLPPALARIMRDDYEPMQPAFPSHLQILWRLWRASRGL